jgi:pantoate--beta-alanine ligase
MDPAAPLTDIRVPALSGGLCGAARPGHFAGVCLVVAKLLNIVQPDRAYFGMKDFQQLRIIEQMVADLDMPVEIVRCPTVRESDGVAMSSRNAYLTDRQRAQAPALHAALQDARTRIEAESPSAGVIRAQIEAHLAREAPDGQVEYIEIVDPRTLANVESTDRPVLIALAVRLGEARLIDNVLVERPGGT